MRPGSKKSVEDGRVAAERAAHVEEADVHEAERGVEVEMPRVTEREVEGRHERISAVGIPDGHGGHGGRRCDVHSPVVAERSMDLDVANDGEGGREADVRGAGGEYEALSRGGLEAQRGVTAIEGEVMDRRGSG